MLACPVSRSARSVGQSDAPGGRSVGPTDSRSVGRLVIRPHEAFVCPATVLAKRSVTRCASATRSENTSTPATMVVLPPPNGTLESTVVFSVKTKIAAVGTYCIIKKCEGFE